MITRPTHAFTLIETLVAITILTIAASGPLSVAYRSIAAAGIARDRLVASYLTQEGVEYVRSLRDSAYLERYGTGDSDPTDNGWNDFLTSSIAGIGSCLEENSRICTLDPTTSPRLAICNSGGVNGVCDPLYFQSSSGIYTQNPGSGIKTKFTRKIQAKRISDEEELITAVTSWNVHGTLYSVTVTDNLTKWQ